MVDDQNKNKIKIMRDDTKDKLMTLINLLVQNGVMGTNRQITRKAYLLSEQQKLKMSINTIKKYINFISSRLQNPSVQTDKTDFVFKSKLEIKRVIVEYADGTQTTFKPELEKVVETKWYGLFDYGVDGKSIIVQKGENKGCDFKDPVSYRKFFQYDFTALEWLKKMRKYGIEGKMYTNKHTPKDIDTLTFLINGFTNRLKKNQVE